MFVGQRLDYDRDVIYTFTALKMLTRKVNSFDPTEAYHPRMRAFSNSWLLSVTWQRLRSHRSIRHIQKPILHANLTAVWVTETELLSIEFLHSGNREFRLFLLPSPCLWPDDLHIRPWHVFPGDVTEEQKMNFLYGKAFKSYRVTYGRTDRRPRNS